MVNNMLTDEKELNCNLFDQLTILDDLEEIAKAGRPPALLAISL